MSTDDFGVHENTIKNFKKELDTIFPEIEKIVLDDKLMNSLKSLSPIKVEIGILNSLTPLEN